MPYIKDEDRQAFDHIIEQLCEELDESSFSAGDINYIISRIINKALSGRLSYAKINELIGVLECAKLELYRRVAAPYEDTKIRDNGEVYDAPAILFMKG